MTSVFRACRCLLLIALAILAPTIAQADDPPTAPATPAQAVVTTIDDAQSSGPIIKFADGKLSLGGDSPREIPLDQVQRIEFGKTVSVGTSKDLVWIGQDNHDLVQVGAAAGGNGVQDLHLHAINLKPQGIKQIVVQCRFPKQLKVWRLDTSQSPHWRLAISRENVAAEAEMYLEPASIDSFGQKFDVTYTYLDGSTATANATATTHSSDQLKVEQGAQPGATVAGSTNKAVGKSELFMGEWGRLQGDIAEMNREMLTLRTVWKSDVQVPLLRIKGIWFGNPSPLGARTDFDKQLAAPVGSDVVFVTAADKTAAQVEGTVQGLADGKLSLLFGGNTRAINRDRALGVVFAAHPKITAPETAYQVFMLTSGDVLQGQLTSLAEGALEIETLWQTRVKIPVAELAEVRSRNGRLTYLSDLEPETVEETPYFSRVIHWRRDQGFGGEPPRVKGKQPTHCVSMHSRCVLTYALDGHFDKFKATLGFDDSAGTRGRVIARVMIDGREAFAQKDFRSDQDPLPVELSLSGAKQLALEIDFGEGEDVGDRVIWAEPRLFRAEQN